MDSFELSTRFMVTWWLAEGNSPPTQTWRKHQWRRVRPGQRPWELEDLAGILRQKKGGAPKRAALNCDFAKWVRGAGRWRPAGPLVPWYPRIQPLGRHSTTYSHQPQSRRNARTHLLHSGAG